jgi:hypothetical protein
LKTTIILRAAQAKPGAKDDVIRVSRLDDVEQHQDQDDEQDRADAASAIVAKPRAHAGSAKTEDQNQNDQKDNHAFSVLRNFTTRSEMQILIVA